MSVRKYELPMNEEIENTEKSPAISQGNTQPDIPSEQQCGEIVTIEEKLRKLQQDYSLVEQELSRVKLEYDRLLKKCETIKLLLASYYIMEEDATDNIVVPPKGTAYWYVRSTFGRSYFDVCDCEWIGGMSDRFRYCRGNFFLEKQTAQLVCDSCNALMTRIRT